MAIETIILYALLGVIVLLLIITMCILASMNSKLSMGNPTTLSSQKSKKHYKGEGVVFCTNCANQFSANLKVCPHCGTTRH